MSVQSELSSDEFKARLYQSLQGKGILDSLKSQLRHKLARELHVLMGMPAQGSPPAKSVGRKCLMTQIADSIVAQYLERKGYEYSLSTFLPESGLNLAEMVSEEDMMNFLRISPSSDAYNKMQTQMQQHERSFLESLLVVVMEGVGRISTSATNEASVQVCGQDMKEEKVIFKTSIAGKLKQLEEKYAQRSEEESGRYKASLEERLDAVKKELEIHYKKQLQTEMELFQMRELTKMRQEEKDKYRAELAKDRDELKQVYSLRMESVKKSEKNSAEMYRRKEKELEASIFSQRQVLLDELNSLKVKEAELKRQAELDKQSIEIERERIKAMSEQMERSLQQMNVQFDLVAKSKAVKLGSLGQSPQASPGEAQHHQDSTVELSLCKDKIKRLEEALSEEKRTMEGVQGRLTEELSRSDSLRRQLQDSTLKNTSLQKANNEAELKLSQCADYLQVKSDSSRIRQQLADSKATIEELEASNKKQRQTIEHLQSQLSQTLPDMATVHKELEQLQEAHRRQVLVLEYDKKHACKKLQAQLEHNVRLKRRLDEQLLQLKSAQREVEDLHFLLEHKSGHKKVGEDLSGLRERKRRDTSINKSSQKTPRTGKSSLRRHPPKSVLPLEYTSSPDISGVNDVSKTPTPSAKTVNFFESQLPLLAESKAAMHRIEKEAEELERTYQEYQQGRAGSSVSALQCRRTNPTHEHHHRTNRELFQSSPKPFLPQGRTTPMDYLKTDSYTFGDPPPLHSTAHHSLFFTEELPVENKFKSSIHTAGSHARTSPPPLLHFSDHQQLRAGHTHPYHDHTHSALTTGLATLNNSRPTQSMASENHLPVVPPHPFPMSTTTHTAVSATTAGNNLIASTFSTVASPASVSSSGTVKCSDIITAPAVALPTSPLVFSHGHISENTKSHSSYGDFGTYGSENITFQAPSTVGITSQATSIAGIATQALSTVGITTQAPLTVGITTEAPSTVGVATPAPLTVGITTEAPSTVGVATPAPLTVGITTQAPLTAGIVTQAPLTAGITTQALSTATCITVTGTFSAVPVQPSSGVPVVATTTTTTTDPISNTARESPTAAATEGATGGSGSLQSWWKSSELDSSSKSTPPTTTTGFSKPAPPTTTTGLSKPAPPITAMGLATEDFSKRIPNAGVSKAASPPISARPSVPAVVTTQSVTATRPYSSTATAVEDAEATPTSRPPQAGFLDSFWKSSNQEVGVSSKSSDLATIGGATSHTSRNQKLEDSSSESEVEESISLTDESQDESKKLSSVEVPHLKQPLKEEEEDTIDPVMLKYMKLVEEKKKSSSATLGSRVKVESEEHDEITSQSSSFNGGVPSEREDDPFEDW